MSLGVAGLAMALGVAAIADNTLPWKSHLPSNEKPEAIVGVGITEKLGTKIDPTLSFTNDRGERVTLGQYLALGKPVVISPVYFSCPNLCNFHLNGVVETLKKMDWVPGREFELVAISIDPKETPELAAAKKENYLKMYGRPEATAGFHFLVGDQQNITAVTGQVGFGYKWDEGSRQWSHSSAAIFLSPTGLITRYLHGIQFSEKTFRLSLVEASEGKIGEIIDKVVLFCFQYDPAQRGYALYAYNIVRGGAGLSVLALGAYFFMFWRQNRNQSRRKIAT